MPTPPGPRPGAPSQLLARLGMALGAFAVFTCGWLSMRAMQSGDWLRAVLFTFLAMASAVIASAFSRRARS